MAEDKKTEESIKVDPVTVTPKEYALEVSEFKPLYEPLGAISVEFGSLETKLNMAINAMLGFGPNVEGVVVDTIVRDYINKVKFFNTLASIKASGILDGFLIGEINRKGTGIRNRLDECASFRNNYLHGNWTAAREDGTFQNTQFTADKELNMIKSMIAVSADDLWRAHQLIFDTALSVEVWRVMYLNSDRLDYMPKAWRERYEQYILRLKRRQDHASYDKRQAPPKSSHQ